MTTQTQKIKYDTAKTLTLISNVESYNDIGNKETESMEKSQNGYKTRHAGAHNHEKQENIAIDKKEVVQKKKIVIPKVQKDENIKEVISNHQKVIDKKKIDKWNEKNSQKGYIRQFLEDILPDPAIYDCGYEDLIQIDEQNSIIDKNGKEKIEQDDFAVIIAIWEEATAKEDPITEDKAKLIVTNISPKTLNQHLPAIYTHWKKLREKYKRPLLRKYWKAHINDDQNNMKQAFKPIKKERMRLRKMANKSDSEMLSKYEFLKKEMQKAEALLNLIKYREMIKSNQNELNMHSFYQHTHFKQVNSSIEVPKYNLQIPTNDARQKFMHNLKKVKHKAMNLIHAAPTKERVENVNPIIQPTNANNVDKKIKAQLPQERIIDNDNAYFICSLISALDKDGQVITFFKKIISKFKYFEN